MGYCFALEHANLVAYLTSPTAEPPRVSDSTVMEALGAIVYGSDGMPTLISRDSEWVERMKRLANEAGSRISSSDSALPGAQLESLQPLREELAHFDVYALVIDDQRDHIRSDELSAVSRELAYSSGGRALILWALPSSHGSIEVLDPIPAVAEAMEHPERWPGMLFWTSSGVCAMVALAELGKVAAALRHADLDGIERTIRDAANPTLRSRRLLHLSDLHFGAASVAENVVMLEAQLSRVVGEVDRVVITGDLFNTPDRRFAASFRAFDASLQRLSGKPPIVIPGNHDIRWLGNVGSFYQHVAATRWQTIVVDEHIGVNFACFDSSEKGEFARGKITTEQLQRVGAALQNELSTHPEYEKHLNVALVHHHPYSFKTTENRTFVQRVLALFGMNEEKFLEMVDAEEFLNWCARWRVSAVLHGHKHVARHTTAEICPKGAKPFGVTAIGCGSSLGAEGSPMSYVLLHWDEYSRRWSTSFFESRSGGPFIRQAVTSTVVT